MLKANLTLDILDENFELTKILAATKDILEKQSLASLAKIEDLPGVTINSFSKDSAK